LATNLTKQTSKKIMRIDIDHINIHKDNDIMGALHELVHLDKITEKGPLLSSSIVDKGGCTGC